MRKTLLLSILLSGTASVVYAQADSTDIFKDAPANKKEFVSYTFKATRIINGSSTENLGAGVLDFRISHRFGRIDQGSENFWGIDNATTRIGLDYGITKWLMVGIAHNALYKENDGFAKVRILRQQKHGMPINLSYAGSMSVQTTKAPQLPPADSAKWHYSNRLYFTNQLLISRKFSSKVSVQVMPTIVHYNLVDSSKYSNNTFAIGIGGRIKLTRRLSVTGEYYYRVTNADLTIGGQKTYNALSIGIEVETGGHVFQAMVTNSAGLTDRTSIGQTTDTWEKGALHFGFNISRVFTIIKPKEFRDGGKTW